MHYVIGRFRKMPDTSMWISPVRKHIAGRARDARSDADGWTGDVATVGLASFLRALGMKFDIDVHGHALRIDGRTVAVVTVPLGKRVAPCYYVPTPRGDSDEVFATLFRDGDYPDLVLAGGVATPSITASHMQISSLDAPIGWVARLSVQADERRSAA